MATGNRQQATGNRQQATGTWTPKQRQKQCEAIRRWKPWQQSSGHCLDRWSLAETAAGRQCIESGYARTTRFVTVKTNFKRGRNQEKFTMDKFIWFLILGCFCGGAMAQDPSTACIQQLSGDVRLQSLFKKAPLDISKGQSLEVLANQSKATVKEKIALAILVSELDQCTEL